MHGQGGHQPQCIVLGYLVADRLDWLRLILFLPCILIEEVYKMTSYKMFLLVYGEDMIAIFQESESLLWGSDLVVDKVGVARTGDVSFT